MKRLLALFVALAVALPFCACAESVLSDGWHDASLNELFEAKEAINQQIAKMMVHQGVPADGFFIDGEGTDIIDGFTLPAGLWRRVFFVPDAASYGDKITLSKDGTNSTVTLSSAVTATPIQCKAPTDVDYMMIETNSKWAISYEPIGMDGTMDASGEGGYVGDCFVCAKPTIVSIEVKNSSNILSNFTVRLYTISDKGVLSSEWFGSEIMANELLSKGDSMSVKAIIKPEDDITAYLWCVSTDQGVTWSITAE